MLDPAQLAALSAIHRRGSFDAAGAVLGISPSAVSLRLKALEDRLGCVLVRRGTPSRATAAGLRLIRHHDEVAALEAALAQELRLPGEGPVTLRIAVNADSLASWVIPALAAVDGFLFDLVIDDQAVSHEWLKQGEVSAAVTSCPGPLHGCETLVLGALRYRATASPGYCARWFAEGPTADRLAVAPALGFSDKDRLQADWVGRNVQPGLVLPAHRIASTQGFVDAALAGLGWGMNPEALIQDHLAAGRLVELLPDTPLDVPLYWQFTRQAGTVLAPVTRAMRAAARAVLLDPQAQATRPEG